MPGSAESCSIVFSLTTDAHTARTLLEFGIAAKPQTALPLHSSFGQLLKSAPKIMFWNTKISMWMLNSELSNREQERQAPCLCHMLNQTLVFHNSSVLSNFCVTHSQLVSSKTIFKKQHFVEQINMLCILGLYFQSAVIKSYCSWQGQLPLKGLKYQTGLHHVCSCSEWHLWLPSCRHGGIQLKFNTCKGKTAELS